MSTPEFGKASENGDGDEGVVDVGADGLMPRENGVDVSETSEDELDGLRRENEELRKEVSELRETVEEMKRFVGMHVADDLEVNCLAPVVDRNADKIEEIETGDNEPDGYVPKTTKARIMKLIEENFEKWSVSVVSGDALVTRVQEQSKRSRDGQNIHDHVGNAMDEEYGEGVEHRQVYDAMEGLDGEGYRLEEAESRKLLFKD